MLICGNSIELSFTLSLCQSPKFWIWFPRWRTDAVTFRFRYFYFVLSSNCNILGKLKYRHAWVNLFTSINIGKTLLLSNGKQTISRYIVSKLKCHVDSVNNRKVCKTAFYVSHVMFIHRLEYSWTVSTIINVTRVNYWIWMLFRCNS